MLHFRVLFCFTFFLYIVVFLAFSSNSYPLLFPALCVYCMSKKYPFYIVSYYIKWFTTYWTYSICTFVSICVYICDCMSLCRFVFLSMFFFCSSLFRQLYILESTVCVKKNLSIFGIRLDHTCEDGSYCDPA